MGSAFGWIARIGSLVPGVARPRSDGRRRSASRGSLVGYGSSQSAPFTAPRSSSRTM